MSKSTMVFCSICSLVLLRFACWTALPGNLRKGAFSGSAAARRLALAGLASRFWGRRRRAPCRYLRSHELRAAREAIRMIDLTAHFDPPLRTRLRFQSQNSNSTRIVEDKALMARTFAWLFGIGATLALVTLLLPGAPDRAELPFIAVAVVAYLTAGLFVLAYDRLPLWL